jgi:hypothetical protein
MALNACKRLIMSSFARLLANSIARRLTAEVLGDVTDAMILSKSRGKIIAQSTAICSKQSNLDHHLVGQ